MNNTRRTLSAALVLSAIAVGAPVLAAKDDDKPKGGQGKGKAKHKNGKDLLGEKIKVNGNHRLAKNGVHTVSVDVKDGKIVRLRAKHDSKGEVAVKKYKTNKKLASLDERQSPIVLAQYMGTTWIGYAYIDEWGYEEIYWYPYDMIYDGDTGAVEYVAAY